MSRIKVVKTHYFEKSRELGMMPHALYHSTRKAEAKGSQGKNQYEYGYTASFLVS